MDNRIDKKYFDNQRDKKYLDNQIDKKYLDNLRYKKYQISFKLMRGFKNNLKILKAVIVTAPLYSILIVDNANIKCYSINGQFIKSYSCNVKGNIRILKDS